jgi:hypothetical protein
MSSDEKFVGQEEALSGKVLVPARPANSWTAVFSGNPRMLKDK